MRIRNVHLGLGIPLLLLVACGGAGTNGFGSEGVDAGGAPRRDGAPATGRDGGQEANSTVSVGSDGSSAPDAGHDAAGTPDASRDAGPPSSDAGRDGARPVDAGHDSSSPPRDSGFDAPVFSDAPFDSSPWEVAIVYGQSATVLYQLDPTTDVVQTVGRFQGCGPEVIDIALDKHSNMFATSTTGVYSVDRTTAACTLIRAGASYPNSLSFVPAGTVDATEEALVGYAGAVYVRIDTTSGAMSTIGNLGSAGHTSSGDIVSVIGGGTYLTVKGGSDCSVNDCLVQVNPTTGALITNYGSVRHAQVFGIAYWAGNVYGFDSAGKLFEVTFPAGGGLGITDIPIPSAPPGLSFYGAGSTTAAPRG